MSPQSQSNNTILIVWLAVVCAVVYAMIVVGGITRLTQSGLSMVDWRPILGAIPPMTPEQWNATFEAYKAYPEYQKINQSMTLDQFKGIFFWEYAHRLLGRIIGLIYFLPFVVFLALKKIDRRWVGRIMVGLLLGGSQGLMGWYMVKSGLVDVPHVSHFRLAAHLLLAIFILAYLFWLILEMSGVRRVEVPRLYFHSSVFLSFLLFVQLLYGAFVAGLDAGRAFNTYPLMHGQFLADAALMIQPTWQNLFENGVMMQFVHRWLAAVLLMGVIALALLSYRLKVLMPAAFVLALLTCAQFILGVVTLLLSVPALIGSIHQALACLVVLAMTFLLYSSSGKKSETS